MIGRGKLFCRDNKFLNGYLQMRIFLCNAIFVRLKFVVRLINQALVF